jgi:3-hydroxypropanoate dehydrogenase
MNETGLPLDRVAERLFTHARTPQYWLDIPVEDATLHQLYDWVKWGPTSMNTQPMRLIFVKSEGERRRLSECVSPGNVEKVQKAPVVAIVGQDMAFADHLPTVFPHNPNARSYFDGKPDVIASTALRNSSLQGGYLILAARLVGLDCGPISGFNPAAVDDKFWAGTSVRSNFLCCLGHGDPARQNPRNPRHTFEMACRIL